jgi:hypothetical protein
MNTAFFTSAARFPLNSTIAAQALRRMARLSPFWWRAALLGLAIFAVFLTASLIDPRMIGDQGVWTKPAKFSLSFVVHALTFALAFSLMPEAERGRRSTIVLSILFCVLFAGVVAYMAFRDARLEMSHFNVATPAAALAYSLMGAAAVGLTAITGYFGWRLMRTGSGLAAEALGTGLILGAVLGTLAGVYMGGQPGHGVGAGEGTGLPLFGWSTTGGDLRVAHFIGLHAMQIAPLAVWLWPRRWMIGLASLAVTLATLAAFLQARAGIPLFAA